VNLDWKSGELAEGLACYRRTEFFQTHEHWEIVWLTLDEPEKSFMQALIQMAAAFHHLQSDNRAGALSLLRKVLRRIECCPEGFCGIAISSLRAEVAESLRLLENNNPSSPTVFPLIHPIDLSV
jgi:hypothetical protein